MSVEDLSRILMVDDDLPMLRAIERRMERHYDIAIAQSGKDGLEILEKEGPFPVIVSDMQMPGMDGIRFVQRARRKSPQSVFVMLTGQVDQQTTLRAMNEGQIFRFLTKPASHEDLLGTLEASWRQYHLINAEKQLLQKTLVGAVDAIVNIFETLMPGGTTRSTAIQKIVEHLQYSMRIQKRWEYALASRLSLLGFGLLGKSLVDVISQPHFNDQDERDFMAKACAKTSEILYKIPRLKTTGDIIAQVVHSTGMIPTLSPMSDSEVVQVGASLLRIGLEWETSRRLGLTESEAINSLRRKLPDLNPEVVNVLQDAELEFTEAEKRRIPIYDLKTGMVVQDSICTKDGRILISEGRRLTSHLLDKLHRHIQEGLELQETVVSVILPTVDRSKVVTEASAGLRTSSSFLNS